MANPFDSAWFKWGWAVVHAQALQRDLDTYAKQADRKLLFTSLTEYNAKSHCIILRIDTTQPTPSRWGLRIGDVANNFRASLDHLAWQLVRLGTARTLTSTQKRNIYFPIAKTKGDFEAALGQLPGLRATHRAKIRRYQPYFRGQRNLHRHCLTPLPDLTRKDKHQEIRPILMTPDSGKLEYGEPQDCTITRVPARAKRHVLKVGAEIQRVYVRKTGPNPDLYMEANLTAQPTLDGVTYLADWLQTTTFHIRNLLLKFGPPPEEITTLGIVPDPNALSLEGIVPS